jgi:hypothetical protein
MDVVETTSLPIEKLPTATVKVSVLTANELDVFDTAGDVTDEFSSAYTSASLLRQVTSN